MNQLENEIVVAVSNVIDLCQDQTKQVNHFQIITHEKNFQVEWLPGQTNITI